MTDQTNTSPIRLCVMQGDGIGPEITAATLDVLRAAAAKWQIELAFDQVEVGLKPLSLKGTTFPEPSFAAAKDADGVILGPVSHNDYPPADRGGINPSGALRKRLDLFANIRPARTRADFPPRCGKPVDLVIVRENTEGFCADRNMFLGTGEMMPTPDLALSMRKITRQGSTRIVEEAFRLALPAEFERLYRRQLATLDATAIVAKIQSMAAGRDAAFVCFEAPSSPAWCHRALISAWLLDQLGLEVFEFGFEACGCGRDHPKHWRG